MLEFTGEFETHLTVALSAIEEVERFQCYCEEHGWKAVWIELDRGQTISHPMLSYCGYGLLTDEMAAAQRQRSQLQTAGFTVNRVKIEASPFNEQVPVSDQQASDYPDTYYFEHHIKLQLPLSWERAPLLTLCNQRSAHLSRNAFKQDSPTSQQRFVTLRNYQTGRDSAILTCRELQDDLAVAGYSILECESEYCVYDSNINLDAGWLKP